MINSKFRKEIADKWFSYLQNQICKEFELIEKGRKKFIKRDWSKKIKKKVAGDLFYYLKEAFLKKLE